MRREVVGLALAAIAAGCASPGVSPARTVTDDATPLMVELNVLAAASLKGALERVAAAYANVDGSVKLIVSTDSSAALETKIEQGAPADLFLAADTLNPTKLADAGYGEGTPLAFAANELSVIVPPDNPGGLVSPVDLAGEGVDIIAAGDEVPVTKYAAQLVENLASVPGYPAGFEAAYAANVASKEENVKAVVAKIELGQGDAAIVYATDAKAATKVTTLDIPPGANVPATYAGVVVRASKHPEAARRFLAWLGGPDGQAILATLGFLPPAS